MPSAGAASTMRRILRGAALVPCDAWATPSGGPASVAVHDDGDVHHACFGRAKTAPHLTRPVICMSTKSVITAPTVTVRPVYPSKKNA